MPSCSSFLLFAREKRHRKGLRDLRRKELRDLRRKESETSKNSHIKTWKLKTVAQNKNKRVRTNMFVHSTQKSKRLVIITPNLFAISTTVKCGHRLISRPDLNLLEVGNLVLTVRTTS